MFNPITAGKAESLAASATAPNVSASSYSQLPEDDRLKITEQHGNYKPANLYDAVAEAFNDWNARGCPPFRRVGGAIQLPEVNAFNRKRNLPEPDVEASAAGESGQSQEGGLR
jgi:hypothetical protein